MTKLTSLIIGIVIILATLNVAEARHNEGLGGLLIGGVGGAAIGHAITQSPEGIIIGSLVGGTIGMLVEVESGRNHIVVINGRHRHHHSWPYYSYRRHWNHRHDKRVHRGHRHDHRWDRNGKHYPR